MDDIPSMLAQLVHKYGIGDVADAFATDTDTIAATLDGDRQAAPRLVERWRVAKALLGDKLKRGRPAETLSMDERIALVRYIGEHSGIPGLTENTIARAIMGRAVIPSSMIIIRRVLTVDT